jgi:homopolymeric O-antigen transport system ATP-binding protein
MSELAIRVANLGKQYTIGTAQPTYRTLRDTIAERMLAPMRRRQAPPKSKGRSRTGQTTFWALKDVSFEVKRGEVVGIIGRNGAGKSTLLKILSRITEPSEGYVDIWGRVGSLLEVGTGFHHELTGRENVHLNGAILGMKRTEILRKFDEIVAFAEVESFIDTPVKHYSSGMQMRLAFAVAAHLEPETLIVDEVLAVGDAEFQKKCLGKMNEVARNEGRAVLFVSHNMTAVQALCSRGIVLVSGQICLDGKIEAALENYLADARTSATGEFDLRHHPARDKHHREIIKTISLRNAAGTKTTVFRPFEKMVLEMKLNAGSTIHNPRAAFAIEDVFGRRITTLASYFCKTGLPSIAGETSLVCTLDELPLGPGRYLISASITDRREYLLDAVYAAGWFEVESEKTFDSYEPYSPGYGPVISCSQWRVA